MDHWLIRSMASRSETAAMIWKGQSFTYEELVRGVHRWSERLSELNVATGERVAICGDYCPETTMLMIALMDNQNVIVPLTPSVGVQREENLKISQVQTAFHFEGDAFKGCTRHDFLGELELFQRFHERHAPGLVLFSSGSTGIRKAVLLDLDKLLAKFQRQRKPYRTLAFLLMDHIGGLNTLFYVLSQGGTVVTVENRDAKSVCQTIARNRVELLPTTPTFLHMLITSDAFFDHDFSSLRLITYGNELMPRTTLRHLRAALPGVDLKQTYGLSELGILQTKSRSEGSLWVKVGGAGYETKIVEDVLWVRSDFAMIGYLDGTSPFDPEGWFNTGDVVETDGEWLRFLGRKSEIINVGGQKVYPAEVEGELLEVENICDASVVGRESPISGQVVVAKVVLRGPESIDTVVGRIRQHCNGRLEPFKIPAVIELSEEPLHGARFKKKRSEP